MRFCLTFRLRNGKELSFVCNASTTQVAKNMAINESKANFSDTNLHIRQDTEIIRQERWAQDKAVKTSKGGYPFNICYKTKQGEIVKVDVLAQGVKVAYNNAVVNYGVNPIYMFIYQANQGAPIKRWRATSRAEEVYRDTKKFNETAKKAIEVTKEIPILGQFTEDVILVYYMIRDYRDGQYKEVPENSIKLLLAMLVYLVSPIDLIPDFVPVVGVLDDAAIVGLALRACHKDIQAYKKWRVETGRP